MKKMLLLACFMVFGLVADFAAAAEYNGAVRSYPPFTNSPQLISRSSCARAVNCDVTLPPEGFIQLANACASELFGMPPVMDLFEAYGDFPGCATPSDYTAEGENEARWPVCCVKEIKGLADQCFFECTLFKAPIQ